MWLQKGVKHLLQEKREGNNCLTSYSLIPPTTHSLTCESQNRRLNPAVNLFILSGYLFTFNCNFFRAELTSAFLFIQLLVFPSLIFPVFFHQNKQKDCSTCASGLLTPTHRLHHSIGFHFFWRTLRNVTQDEQKDTETVIEMRWWNCSPGGEHEQICSIVSASQSAFKSACVYVWLENKKSRSTNVGIKEDREESEFLSLIFGPAIIANTTFHSRSGTEKKDEESEKVHLEGKKQRQDTYTQQTTARDKQKGETKG